MTRFAKTAATVALLLIAGCATKMAATDTTRAPKYKVIGYIMGARVDISRIGAEKLTHINYAFGLVSTNGDAFIRTNAPSHLAQLHALKAKNPQLKIILSIGGWGADNFSDAALTDESRQKFARSCVNILKQNALDGIDLDWEYPGQPGPGIKFRAEDKENFTFMLRDLRLQLDALSDQRKRVGADRYTLTIASAGGSYFKHTEMEKVHGYLDWINIMTYDMYGVGTPPGHHSGLRAPGDTNRFSKSTEGYVKEHLASGIPPEKLVVGAAFYAKSWTNVTSLPPKLEGGKFQRGFPYSALARNYLNTNGFERRWDEAAQASYLWNAQSNTFVSFEDPEALKAKAKFVKANRLGGVMYWEYTEDLDETLLNALAAELR
jgi:chitinase